MIPELRRASKTFQSQLSVNALQNLKAKIKKQKIPAFSFIRIRNEDFSFIYKFFPVNYPKNNNSKISKIRSPTSINQQANEEDILLKGCKSFLKNCNVNLLQIETVIPQLQFLFCELIVKNQTGDTKYLVSKDSQLLHSDILGQSERIWVCEKQNHGRVRFVNYCERNYLSMDPETQTLKIVQIPSAHTLFRLDKIDQYDQYELISISARSSQDVTKPQIVGKGSFKVKIIEIKDSLIKLQSQRMYMEWNLGKQKLIRILVDGLKQMLFFDNNQFANNNQIVTKQAQQYFYQYKITHRIAQLLYNNIQNVEVSQDFSFSSIRNSCFKLCSYLCQNHKNNSKLFHRVLTAMFINLLEYRDDILQLISQNPLFKRQFYREGWFKIMLEKVYNGKPQQLQKIMPKIYEICALMCINPSSLSKNCVAHVPNQYLLHHTISENLPNSHFGLDITVHGQYVFLIHEKQSTQIKTYLEKGQQKQEDQYRQNIFKSWIKLISAICCGCNVNCISEYRDVIKALVPYCYLQKFPVLVNSSIKQTILQAFVAVEQRQSCQQLFQNKYTVGIIDTFISQTQSKSYFIFSTKQLHKKIQNPLSIRDLRELFVFFIDFCNKEYQQLKNGHKNLQEYWWINEGLKSWLKVVELCLGARLIEIKEKKSSQILRYVKKIFEKVETQLRKEKEKAQEKMFKDFFMLILEILQFSPQYQKYLLSIDYVPKRNFNYELDMNNQLNQLNQLFKINNQNKMKSIFIESYIFITKDQNNTINRNVTINEIIANLYPPNQNSQQILDTKLHICNVLVLVLQKINEEQVQEAVKTLEYWIKQPTHLTRYDLVDFKPSYIFQEAMKMILIQQWYLISHPALFNKLTTCLRYIYRKNEIYRNMVKDLAVIDHSLSMKFYQILSANTQMLRKSIAGVNTWLRNVIIVKYQQQLDFLYNNFKQIALLLQKIQDMLIQQNQYLKQGQFPKITHKFLQKILQQCSLINIIVKYSNSVNQLDEKTRVQKFDILQKIDQFILKILLFYIQDNTRNSIVVIHFLGQYLTKLPNGVQCVIMLLKTYHEMIECLSDASWQNLIKNLPGSLMFFEALSQLPANIFIKGVEKIDKIFLQIWSNVNRSHQQLGNQIKTIIKNHEVRMVLLKIGCRILYYFYKNDINFGFFLRSGKYLSWIWKFLKQSLQIQTRIIQKSNSEMKQSVLQKKILSNVVHYYLIAENQDFCMENSKIPIVVQKEIYKEEIIEFSHKDINSIIVEYLRKQLIVANRQESYEPSIGLLEYYVFDLLPIIQYHMYLFQQYSVIEKVKYMIQNLKNKKNNIGKMTSVQIIRLQAIEDLLKLVEKHKFIEIQKVELKPRLLEDYQTFQNILQPEKSPQKPIQSAPIKKWQKAKRKFLVLPILNPSLIQDFVLISSVYQQFKFEKKFFETSTKNKIQQTRYLPIMPKDLFSKLYTTVNNMYVLELTQQNRIFLLEEFLTFLERVFKFLGEQQQQIFHNSIGQKLLETLYKAMAMDITTIEMSLYIKIITVSSQNLQYLNIDFLATLLKRVSQTYPNDLITLYLLQKSKQDNPLLLLLHFIDKISFPPADSQTLRTLYQQLLKIKIQYGSSQDIKNLCENILSKLKILMYKGQNKKQQPIQTQIQLTKEIFLNPYYQLLYAYLQNHQYDL